MKSRLAAVVGFAALLAVLSGCEPWPVPPDRSQASMSISLGAEGGADVRLILGGQTQAHEPLLRTGTAVASALFPTASRRSVRVEDNGGGYPLVHIHAAGVYKRGKHPVVSIDTRPALTALSSMGYVDVDVDVAAPGVPSTATWRRTPASEHSDSWSWSGVTPAVAGPSGTIELNPQPLRGIGTLGLAALCFAGCLVAVFGLRRRHRLLAGVAALVACAATVVDTVTAGAVQPDNLGVAGWLNGLELNIAKWMWIPATLAAIAAMCLFFVTIDRTRPPTAVPQFNAPPGWPPAPPGWRPLPGWQPDPAWPLPPSGWVFYPPAERLSTTWRKRRMRMPHE